MKVRDRFEEIRRLDVEVLAISFASPELLRGFGARLNLPFSVAADPERNSYRKYGLLTGSRWAVWHPRVLWKYAVLISRGMKLQRPSSRGDLSQLGGDFVIDRCGKIRLAHPSRRPDDRPDVSVLLRALASPQ